MQLSEQEGSKRLVIISNRLPVVLEEKNGDLSIEPGSGGLVTALEPVLRNRGGLWVGWPGHTEFPPEIITNKLTQLSQDYTYAPVFLSKAEVNLFYQGFSNEIVWPLFHDLHIQCNFDPSYWQCYQEVNRKYALKVKENISDKDFIWVHDYQLMYVAKELRELNVKASLSFFLHIPFPPLDIFLKLPWRTQILQALLEFDLIGFQTLRDRRNFTQCVKALLKAIPVKTDKGLQICKVGDREVRLGTFPIGIDFKEFNEAASSKQVYQFGDAHKESLRNSKVVLSVDRLDYTKGILLRLKAIQNFLETYPEMHEKMIFLQIVVPSRVDIIGYQNLKKEIDESVSQINSLYSKLDWVPVHYMFHSIPKTELLAYYRYSDVCLITSVKDGMNLVAKEYIACSIDKTGSLVLSEFAGASAQLHESALMTNPYDYLLTAKIIHQALMMPNAEKKKRMTHLRRIVRRYDIYWWVQSFLKAAIAKDLSDFPILKNYLTTT